MNDTKDQLSEFLDSMRVHEAMVMRLRLSAPFAFSKPEVRGIPFRIFEGAPCWLKIQGSPWRSMNAGDVVLLPHGDAHIIASSPEVSTIPIAAITQGMRKTDVESGAKGSSSENFIEFNAPDWTFGVTGSIIGIRHFGRSPIIDSMGKIIHIRAGMATGVSHLTTALHAIVEEARRREPGWHVATCRIVESILIQTLRTHFIHAAATDPGWFRGMRDPKIGKALLIMHESQQHDVDVESLAQAVNLSRSRFSAVFSELLGCSPMAYLTRLRLHQAMEALARGASLSNVAEGAGYASEKSFSRAFRKWSGNSPGRLRDTIRTGSAL